MGQARVTLLLGLVGLLFVEGGNRAGHARDREERVVGVPQPVVLGGHKLIALGVEKLVLDGSWLVWVASDWRVDTLRDEEAGGEANYDEGNDPSDGGLEEHPLVDTLGALEQRDAGGGTDLAVGGRERQAEVRADDDDNGCAQLDGETTRRRDHGQLDTNGTHDVVAIQKQAEADASTAERQDPVRVVADVRLLGDLARVVDDVDGHEGAHRVGNVVGAMSEGVADGGEDLDVPEDSLGHRVELLGVVVHRLHGRVLVDRGVDVDVDAVRGLLLGVVPHLPSPRTGAGLGHCGLAFLNFLCLGINGGCHVNGDDVRILLRLKLARHPHLDLLVERDENDGNRDTDRGREAESIPALRVPRGIAQKVLAMVANLLRDTLRDDEEGVNEDGQRTANGGDD
eukprot:3682534-Pleurochrysis_carterae.AAC.2